MSDKLWLSARADDTRRYPRFGQKVQRLHGFVSRDWVWLIAGIRMSAWPTWGEQISWGAVVDWNF